MGTAITLHANNEADTSRLGEVLANVLPDGTVVGLIGPLGAGKTRLVQAVAAASGVAKLSRTSACDRPAASNSPTRSIASFSGT